jgi:hypothetical protein
MVSIGSERGLARDAAQLHHRLAAGEGQHHRHLQDQAEGVADVVGVEFLEALGAVAALQQERAALGHVAEQALETARLARKDQRRHLAKRLLDPFHSARIRIVGRDVLGGFCSPGGGGPTRGHDRLYNFKGSGF